MDNDDIKEPIKLERAIQLNDMSLRFWEYPTAWLVTLWLYKRNKMSIGHCWMFAKLMVSIGGWDVKLEGGPEVLVDTKDGDSIKAASIVVMKKDSGK